LGCMAQNLKEELTDFQPLVDVLAGPDAYRQLPMLIRNAMRSQEEGLDRKELAVDLSEYETYYDVIPDRNDGVNAWIAVMRGCDNFCSFCVVPYTRGRERSRNPEGIVQEARRIAEQGFKQITLLGQNVNSYRFGDWDFARLITAVADVAGIQRVRFTSPHPKDFPVSLLEAVASHPRICKHIHLPLQSGSDRILGMMNRTYTNKEFRALVDRIRTLRSDIVLSTDIICGFCGESDEEFAETYRLVEEMRFHSAYIFKYSERKNTIAARKFSDDVSDPVKTERVTRLFDLQRNISYERNREYLRTMVPVLVEGDSKRSTAQGMGKSDGNITVIWDKRTISFQTGDMVSLSIYDASSTTLYAERPPEA
jgi:tRNA-2-methylthio-N6-dimethylallyladenosine synthase